MPQIAPLAEPSIVCGGPSAIQRRAVVLIPENVTGEVCGADDVAVSVAIHVGDRDRGRTGDHGRDVSRRPAPHGGRAVVLVPGDPVPVEGRGHEVEIPIAVQVVRDEAVRATDPGLRRVQCRFIGESGVRRPPPPGGKARRRSRGSKPIRAERYKGIGPYPISLTSVPRPLKGYIRRRLRNEPARPVTPGPPPASNPRRPP